MFRLSRLAPLLRRSFRLIWQPLPASEASSRSGSWREHAEMVSLVLFVFLALFGIKAFIAWRDLDSAALPPQVVTQEFWPSVGRLFLCSAEDGAVGAACLFLVSVALRLIPSLNGRRVVRFLAHVLAALALAFMLVNAQVFHVLRCFVTYSLFLEGGGFQPERSVQEYATLEVRVAVGLLPLLILEIHLSFTRVFPTFWQNVPRLVCRPLLLILAFVGLGGAGVAAQNHDLFREHRTDFAQNPHLLLARSCIPADDDEEDGTSPDTVDFEPGRPHHVHLQLEKRPKNIVVIVLESGGSRYMQRYGFPLETTPNLERLADRSVRIEHFYSTSNKTIAAALPICGSTWNDPHTLATAVDHPNCPVPAVSTWLGREGYHTAFLGAGGRRVWEGYCNLHDVYASRGWDVARDGKHPFWAEVGGYDRFSSPDYLDQELFADARRYIRSSAGRKFFLLMWNYDTHAPFFAREDEGPAWDEEQFPPSIRGTGEKENEFRRYLNSLRRTDAMIGSFYDWLESEGIADDTLVVVTGDHGEAWGQHGQFAHGPTLYEEEVRVPLLLIHRSLAEKVGPNLPIVGSQIDIWATITDVCGLPFDPRWQGRSLLGGDSGDRRAMLYRREGLGVREGRFKYLWDQDTKREWLFDVVADPEEKHNLAKEYPSLCARQFRRVRAWSAYQGGLTRHRIAEAESK